MIKINYNSGHTVSCHDLSEVIDGQEHLVHAVFFVRPDNTIRKLYDADWDVKITYILSHECYGGPLERNFEYDDLFKMLRHLRNMKGSGDKSIRVRVRKRE